MPQFGEHSRAQLATVHPLLQGILQQVIVTDDFAVTQGGRTDAEQWAAFNSGNSKEHPPRGNHLIQPDGFAYAADLWPCPGGKMLAVPSWKEMVDHVKGADAAEAAKYLQDAVAAYCQFVWLMRKVEEVGLGYLEAHRLTTGERYHLRFGIDWNGNGIVLLDQDFDDYPHVELHRETP